MGFVVATTKPEPVRYWGIPPRKKRAIAGGEWHIKFFLDVDGIETEAGTLRYSDAALATSNFEFGRSVAGFAETQAEKFLKKKKGRRTK